MNVDLCTILFSILGRVMNGEPVPEGFLHKGILYEVSCIIVSGDLTRYKIECWEQDGLECMGIRQPTAWIEVGQKT